VARASLEVPDRAPERARVRHVTLVPEHGTRVTLVASRAPARAAAHAAYA
jgi:hypothetical protein